MAEAKLTTEEMFESLTGFDEIAIGKAFGGEVSWLAKNKPTMFLRALVFIHERREGMSDADAKERALSMPLRDSQDYFIEDEDEVTPDEPTTESGEGSAASA